MNVIDKHNSALTSPAMVLFIVSIVQFLNPFMASGVGIALPTIGKAFNAGAMQLGMIEMTYLLSVSILLLPAGRFSDIHGRKKVFITGISIFTVSTLFLSLTDNVTSFIIVRFIQGAGAAMITSTSLAILTSVFPGKGRGPAMGIATASVYAGISVGPTLAGVIITNFGWRWIFIIPFFFQITALILTVTRLKGEWADSTGEKFDIRGSVIFSSSIFLIIWGILGITKSTAAPLILLAGTAGMVLFYRIEKKTEHPLLDFKLLTSNRTFAFSNIATMINYASSFGVTFLLSLYLQSVRGFSPQTAGLILMTQPLIQVIFSYISGRMSDSIDPGKIATAGMALCAGGLIAASFITPHMPLQLIYLIMVLMGLGFGFFSSANMSAIMGSVKPREYGVASSMLATMRTSGMLISMTIVTFLISIFMGSSGVVDGNGEVFTLMMKYTFILFAVLSATGTVLSAKARTNQILHNS